MNCPPGLKLLSCEEYNELLTDLRNAKQLAETKASFQNKVKLSSGGLGMDSVKVDCPSVTVSS